MDLASRKVTVLTSALNWDVDEFDLSQDGHWIAFEANEDGISMLHVLDTTTNKEAPVPKLPVGVMDGINGAQQPRNWVFAEHSEPDLMMRTPWTWLRASSSDGRSARPAG